MVNGDQRVLHATHGEGKIRVTSLNPDYNPPRRVTTARALATVTRRAAIQNPIGYKTNTIFDTPVLLHAQPNALPHSQQQNIFIPAKKNGT
jgi:hypothetical protein